MDNPGQPLLTDTMVDHCSITMVKPCLTIVKTNHASPILQKCQNHGKACFNHCISCYSMVLQLWFSMVKHGLTMVKHGYTHIISQGDQVMPNVESVNDLDSFTIIPTGLSNERAWYWTICAKYGKHATRMRATSHARSRLTQITK